MSDSDTVFQKGLKPGALIAAVSGSLKGTQLRIIEGTLEPSGPAPHAHTNFTMIEERHAIRATVVTLAGLFTKKPENMEEYRTNGVYVGAKIDLPSLQKIHTKRTFAAYHTGNWVHVSTPSLRAEGRGFNVATMSVFDGAVSGNVVEKDWGILYAPITQPETLNLYIDKCLELLSSPFEHYALTSKLSQIPPKLLLEILQLNVRSLPVKIATEVGQIPQVVFHVIAAAIVIYSPDEAYLAEGLRSGTYRYAHAIGADLYEVFGRTPLTYAACILAGANIQWTMESSTLVYCIRERMSYAKEDDFAPVENEITKSILDEVFTELSEPPIRKRVENVAVPYYRFITRNDLFLFTKTIDAEMFGEIMRNMRDSDMPWNEIPEMYLDEISAAQKAYYLNFLAKPETLKLTDNINKKVFDLSLGWLASMVGAVSESYNGEDLDVYLNIFNPLGEPLVLRSGNSSNSDDLSEEAKKQARIQFFSRFCVTYQDTMGHLDFKHVPSSISKFKDFGLRCINGTCYIVKPYLRKYDIIDEVGKSLPLVEFYSEHSPMEIKDYTGLYITGTGLAVNAMGIIENAFKSLTRAQHKRAIFLMRHMRPKIVFNTSRLNNGDRAVFSLMCTLAAVAPCVVKRSKMEFIITDGPFFWDITKKYLHTVPPSKFEWAIPHSGRIKEIRDNSFSVTLENDSVLDIAYSTYRPKGYVVGAKYEQFCTTCTERPIIMNKPCGHVHSCAKCFALDSDCMSESACPICGVSGVSTKVKYPEIVDVKRDGSMAMESKVPELFPWQLAAVEKLCKFVQRSEVVWLPPGAGKTLVGLAYHRWCNTNNCATKYFVWVTTKSAIGNLAKQCERSRIGYHIVKGKNVGTGTFPVAGKITIIPNTLLVSINLDDYSEIYQDLTIVYDEFHTLMARSTKRAQITLEIAQNAFRVIPMSGTIYKNSASSGELATFMSMCVDFAITPINFRVSLGLMIAHRVDSRSTIRRATKEVCAEMFGLSTNVEADDVMEEAMISRVRASVEEEIGVIMCVRSDARAEIVAEKLRRYGIRTFIQTSANPVSYGPKDFPDTRGPGIIASGAASSTLTIEDIDDSEYVPQESLKLPQVIIFILKQGRVEGFDMNRYRRMLFGVYPSNDATITQAEGRIDRVNNDAPFIEYEVYYTAETSALFAAHEIVRAKAEALRDAQTGGTARRVYETAEREKTFRDARSAQEKYDAKKNIESACEFFGIEFTYVLPALKQAATRVYRTLSLKWHPDRWSNCTPEEISIATEHMKRIGGAYDLIKDYCSAE